MARHNNRATFCTGGDYLRRDSFCLGDQVAGLEKALGIYDLARFTPR